MPPRSFVLALGLGAAACGEAPPPVQEPAPAPLPALPRAASPRYDEVSQLGTHNAYWVDRGVEGDLFASGVGERLLDQLAFERVRSLELDLHRDEARAGEFRVYHTRPGNGLCDSLRDCLGEVRAFAWAAPRHEPITLILELKELFAGNFDERHTIADLDRLLREELGAALFEPAELLARCPGDATLSGCVARAGWPGLVELRGRVIVALLGNWDELGAQATVDWARYAGGAIAERAAFPMASSWKLRAAELAPRLAELATQADLDAALAQSVFLQVEELADPRLGPFLAAGGVVRANGAEGVPAQEQRLELGVQILQTDTPWLRARDRGVERAMIPRAVEAPVEPGRRVLLEGRAGEAVFAYREGDGAFEMAALISAGRSGARGCLRAAVAIDGESLSVCRGKLERERVFVEVERCAGGECVKERTLANDPGPGGVGDVVGLVGDPAGCIIARSARTASRTREPEWVVLGEPWCPSAPARLRGLAAGEGRVGFFGLAGAGAFTVQVSDDSGGRVESARLVDASGE
jgi:hypothetical protein